MGGLTRTPCRRSGSCRRRKLCSKGLWGGKELWSGKRLCVLVALVLVGGCSSVPISPRVTSVRGLDGSADHGCAVTVGGEVRCWGDNRFGQLGDGTVTDPVAGATVRAEVSGVVGVATGSEFTCGLERAGTVTCWGFNLSGQLGNGSKDGISLSPVRVSGVIDVVDIAAGGDHACAVSSDGHLSCWGGNDFGQLGDGTTIDRTRPVEVVGVDDAVQVTAGTGFTCVRRRGGEVACWGLNSLGQLGDLGFHDSPTPLPVVGLGRTATVDAGLDDVCAVVIGADLRCWGAGETLRSRGGGAVRPTMLPGTSAAVAIAVGERTACALRRGRVICWDTTTGDRTLQYPVRPGSDLVAVAVSDICTAPRGGAISCRRLR